jgi:hypothetical protein
VQRGCTCRSFRVQESTPNPEPIGLGRLRRPFFHPGVRSQMPMQSDRSLHGVQR